MSEPETLMSNVDQGVDRGLHALNAPSKSMRTEAPRPPTTEIPMKSNGVIEFPRSHPTAVAM